MHYKLAQLILTPGKNASTTSDVFISQPDSAKEALAGKLFILIEIASKKQDNLKIINFLIDNINHNYYQNEKLLLREKISTLKIEHIFESALAKTNKNLADFIQQEKIKTDFESINVIAGIIFEDEIHFVNSGKNKAFLIYRQKIEGVKKGRVKEEDSVEYKIIDIVEQSGANKRKKDDDKLFTNVISGKIPKRGHFIITNEALPEYISTKQLMKIATTLPPASAVEQIKSTLENINSYVSFLGIVIKSTTIENEPTSEASANLNTRESIKHLNQTEANTENILAASGVINPKQWIKGPETANIKKSQASSLEKPFVLKDKIFGKRRSTFSFIAKIFSSLKDIILHFFSFLAFLWDKLKTRKTETISLPSSPAPLSPEGSTFSLKEKISSFFRNRFSLPDISSRKSKVLLSLSLLFLAMFVVNIYAMKQRSATKLKTQEYENNLALIEKKQNQAEAFLLYNNKESAIQIIPEIKGLLDLLPQETEEQKNKYQELKQKYDLQNEKISNIVRLKNIPEIANLKNVSTAANGENIIYSPEKNKLFVADSPEKSIYIIDLKDNSVFVAADTGASINKLLTPELSKDGLVQYLNQDSLITLDDDGKINKAPINLNGSDKAFSAAAVYNDKLYAVSTAENQVLKYNFSDNTYNDGQTWLKKETDLSDATDLSIDGNIYILKKSGQILKYLKGEAQKFELDPINPPLAGATAFANQSALKYLYIIEPQNKRLVVYTKDGKFVQQYVSDQFTDLRDFSVDEKNKIIYFLNGAAILKASTTHL